MEQRCSLYDVASLYPAISVDIRCVDITCFDRAFRVSRITIPRQHSLPHFNVYYKLVKGPFRYTRIHICTNGMDCTRLFAIIKLSIISMYQKKNFDKISIYRHIDEHYQIFIYLKQFKMPIRLWCLRSRVRVLGLTMSLSLFLCVVAVHAL